MSYMNIQLPFMIQDFFDFWNLNQKVNGKMYIFSYLMNYTPSQNDTYGERILETFDDQKAPDCFR